MKKIIMNSIFVALAACLSLTACKKEQHSFSSGVTAPPTPPPIPTDTLKGKEFIFEDLPWSLAGPGAVAEEEIWIGVENRPDLFSASRPMEVLIKFDTTSTWMMVPKWNWPSVPANAGYLYVIMYGSSFYVESYPLNFQLIGRKASLKIRFL